MSDERPPNKRQLQAAATRERVLVAARDVFETKGYRATSVGAIAEAAETAHGTFYLYFKNKDDAFTQVMAAVDEEFRAAQPTQANPDRRESLAAVLRGFLQVFLVHGGLWRALLEGMLQSPAIEQMWLETRARLVDRISHNLQAEQRAGLVRDFDPAQVALALGSMAEWYAFTSLVIGGREADPDAVERAVDTLTDIWLHAIYGVADEGLLFDGMDRSSLLFGSGRPSGD